MRIYCQNCDWNGDEEDANDDAEHERTWKDRLATYARLSDRAR